MHKIVWISDFSVAEVQGGAEIVDAHLMSLLQDAGHTVVFSPSRGTSDLFIKSMADEYIFIVSNFVGLDPHVRSLLGSTTYYIVEHDHKYLRSRDPSPYTNFLAPKEEIVNRDFYKKAQKVFCQSTKHGEIVKNNLKLGNIITFGSTFWSEEHIDILRNNIKSEKNII